MCSSDLVLYSHNVNVPTVCLLSSTVTHSGEFCVCVVGVDVTCCGIDLHMFCAHDYIIIFAIMQLLYCNEQHLQLQ